MLTFLLITYFSLFISIIIFWPTIADWAGRKKFGLNTVCKLDNLICKVRRKFHDQKHEIKERETEYRGEEIPSEIRILMEKRGWKS